MVNERYRQPCRISVSVDFRTVDCCDDCDAYLRGCLYVGLGNGLGVVGEVSKEVRWETCTPLQLTTNFRRKTPPAPALGRTVEYCCRNLAPSQLLLHSLRALVKS